MRTPTPIDEQLLWHTAALASGADAMTVSGDPQVGWYQRRLVKKGCWVPARIWLEQEVGDDGELLSDQKLRCEVDGVERDAADQWLWLCQNPITERAFNYLKKLRAWQRVNRPDEWDPMVPIDHTRTPITEEG